MSNKVFVVQRPAYFDHKRRGWVNKYDLTPAEEYGELVFLLPPGNIYKDHLGRAQDGIQAKLQEMTPEDHLLAVGDPVAIAAAVLIAADVTGGPVSLLKFDRLSGKYEAYRVGPTTNDG